MCIRDRFITDHGVFSVSIMNQGASSDMFGRFGYRTGKDFDKMDGMNIRYGDTGVPVVLNECLAYLECKVVQTVDVGSHLMFIGEIVNAEILDEKAEPLTYQYYRQVKKGLSPKNAPTYIDKSRLQPNKQNQTAKKYKCTACGYIYDDATEQVLFADLSSDWVCPACGSEKADFIEIV